MDTNEYNKPVVLISQCIEHGHCRYDGGQISSSFVAKLSEYIDFITVCPEVAIGLTVPREAIRIIEDEGEEHLVYSMSGTEVSESMIAFSKSFADTIKDKRIHGFILKSRSPSCGIKDVKLYATVGKAPSMRRKTTGFFGRVILNAYDGMPIEDEGRLTNYNLREHFLTRVYTMASFDHVLESESIQDLIRFHSNNKYLLMAYHQGNLKLMGKLVANHEDRDIKSIIDDYYKLLKNSLSKPLKRGTNINMLMHLLGYFKNELIKEEKAYFLDMLERYSNKKVPFSVLIALIYSWVVRFNEPYLKEQTIFKPFPAEILDVSDSGKGID